MPNLLSSLWDSLKRIKLALVVDMAFLLAFWAMLIDPSKMVHVEARWLILGAIFLVFGFTSIIIILWDLLLVTRKESKRGHFPRVLQSYKIPYLVLALEQSDLFSVGDMVSVFHKDAQRFETQIGIGWVSVVQPEERLIQITVSVAFQERANTWDMIMLNDKQALEAIVVKPNISHDIWESQSRVARPIEASGEETDD